MTPKAPIDRFIYAVVILVCLAAVLLVLLAPPEFLSNRVVYQGF